MASWILRSRMLRRTRFRFLHNESTIFGSAFHLLGGLYGRVTSGADAVPAVPGSGEVGFRGITHTRASAAGRSRSEPATDQSGLWQSAGQGYDSPNERDAYQHWQRDTAHHHGKHYRKQPRRLQTGFGNNLSERNPSDHGRELH